MRIGTRAFTLIEVMVAVSIFSIVMLISTGAIFSIVEANKKAHSVKSVMTNLNFALESMSRDIRVGSSYSCDAGSDCLDGGTSFGFKANRDVNGDGIVDAGDDLLYSRNGSRIMRRAGSQPETAITASEIQVTNLKFYVTGSQSGGDQPKVLIVIQGYSGTSTTRSDFNIQTTVSQRAGDI
jgi:prepilin-type N-terminal cleavage/methylation domain-containing protein